MGAMIGTEVQKKSFNERLDRIARGGENTNRHVHVGPVEEDVARGKRRARKARVPRSDRPRTFWSELFMLPFALLAGASAVLAGRVGAYHLVPDVTAAETLGIPVWTASYGWITGAAVLALIAMLIFRLRGGGRFKALFVGFCGMVLFEHLVIAQVPDVFAPLYSEEHVAGVIAKFASGA